MRWGLALSGGGALGAAHLGLLRALRAFGFDPPLLAGTSAGGLVAGALAAGACLDDLTAYGATVSAHPLHYFQPEVVRLALELSPLDPAPPAAGLLDPARFVAGLEALCPYGRHVADWRRPTVLTAVDLAARQAVAFVGPTPVDPPHPSAGGWRVVTGARLRVALHATMAMPGFYTPVVDVQRGWCLVDGGVADTLPVDWAAALGASRVLAVNVASQPLGLPPRIGIEWVLQGSEGYVLNTLSRLRRPAGVPLLVLRPDTAWVPFPGFAQYEELVEIGYRTAVDRRAEIEFFLARA